MSLIQCRLQRHQNQNMNSENSVDDGLQDLGRLPVPVQTFLWRQIAPFVRPKLGKLHEANCMVRKKKSHFIFN